ncbi:MAG: hypothetical protein IJ553_01835 [Alloprevotella sp.]|nr:hypothetical protein [Alloprevotella sp.]
MTPTTHTLLQYPRSIAAVTSALSIVAIVLYAIESQYCKQAADYPRALWLIVVIPLVCFALLSVLELKATERQRRSQSPTLIGTYMLFKGIRLLLTLAAILAYVMLGGPLHILFVINVGIFFLVSLIGTSLCHIKAERQRDDEA